MSVKLKDEIAAGEKDLGQTLDTRLWTAGEAGPTSGGGLLAVGGQNRKSTKALL